MRSRFLIAIAAVLSITSAAHASDQLTPEQNAYNSSIISAYRLYKEVPVPSLPTPTVVETPFTEPLFERNDVAVFNMSVGKFEPSYVKISAEANQTRFSAQSTPSTTRLENMTDGNAVTYAEFPLPNSERGRVQITLTSAAPATAASLTTLLDTNVSLPTTIEIRARVAGADTIVVAERVMDTNTIRFPKTTSNAWTITYTYAQPLRISELRLVEEVRTTPTKHSVRFLAQPGQFYRVYFDPDRLVRPNVAESANLASAQDVVLVPAGESKDNFEYRIADIDSDGVPDIRDNCVSLTNADQADINSNGRGDVCDDFDQDGIINTKDNCPDQPNVSQEDKDSDDKGDVCDQEESRVTEKYAWLPWAGLGFAALVLVLLFAIMLRKPVTATENPPTPDTPPT